MKIARGTRGAAVVLSLLSIAACSPSAASRPKPLPGPTQATADAADIRIEQDVRTEGAEQVPANAATQPAPRKATGTQTEAAAPRTAAAASVGRAAPRFDIDGDGKDELVVGSFTSPGGFVLHVRYSGLPRRDALTAPITAEPRYDLASQFAAGDFNGDGFQDLAVSSYRMLSQGVFENGIFVWDGGSGGLDRDNVKYLAGLHARALASGDLNNDGKDELAVADGGANPDGPFRGQVTVLSGTRNGLTPDGSVRIHQVVPRWPGLAEEDFGTQLAMGDFTGDGYDDLVVNGTRRGTAESDWHGMVTLFPGSDNGPSVANVTKIEGHLDTAGDSMPVDVMVMSDMDQDGRDDLILGLPRHMGGRVIYIRGAVSGLGWAGRRVIDQDTPGVPGQPDNDPNGGHFGYSLATGDVTGDGIPDLLVGAMTMTVGAVADAGSVTLLPGTPQGPTGAGSFVYTQYVAAGNWPKPQAELEDWASAISDRPEPSDYLGSSVAILDLDGTGPLEMFVEAKYEDMWQQAPGEPYGLITTLRLQGRPIPHGSSRPSAIRLMPVKQQRPADFSGPGFRVIHFGYGLLSS